MVNEVIMYQSMFLLGIVAFGFFSVTFNNYTEIAEDLVAENNLEAMTQDIGSLITELISTGQQMLSSSNSFIIKLAVQLNTEIRGAFSMEFAVNGLEIELNTILSGSIVSSYNTGYVNSTDIRFFSSVNLLGSRTNQYINFSYDGTDQDVFFSRS